MDTYDTIIASLRAAYDRGADERERSALAPWKEREREAFLAEVRAEGRRTLLELGAGTGKDGLFFQQHGLEVTCIDLSPAMVALCRQKGLRAHVRDLLHLDLPPGSFAAVHALNCLLHVPRRDLPAALAAIREVMETGGLFYLGVYGGIDHEGIWAEDTHRPKRFFSYHTDDGIRRAVEPFFDLLAFACIPTDRAAGLHFQSLLLRR
jgi:SAM-dependent methyltransferase